MKFNGLWVPLITPLWKGALDRNGLQRLIASVEPFVDGYIPCLSTGEGEELSDRLWEETVRETCRMTKKPVAAGILRSNTAAVLRLARRAKVLGCMAVIIPTISIKDAENLRLFTHIDRETPLPLIIYNRYKFPIRSLATIKALSKLHNVVGMKDSSRNIKLFHSMLNEKQKGRLRLSLLQGWEDLMPQSIGCDGAVLSLANTEPKLCQGALQNDNKKAFQLMGQALHEQNLGGQWVATLKGILYARGIIRSAEEVKQILTE